MDWFYVVMMIGALASLATPNTTAAQTTPKPDSDLQFANDEHAIRDLLFNKRNYDDDIPPQRHQGDNITLQFEVAVLKTVDLDEQRQLFTVDGWAKMAWTDFRLAWDETEYKDKVNQMNISPKKIWLPDLAVFNTGDGNYSPHSEQHPALVFSSGYVMYIPQVRYVVHCAMDITRFPFDTQVCHLQVGSWTFDAIKLNVVPFDAKEPQNFTVDVSFMSHHAEWKLTRSNGTKNIRYYPCCPNTPYADIIYAFEFDRKSSYFVHVFIGPAVVLALLIPFMFTMQADHGEKFILGGSIMICTTLMLTLLSGLFVNMPVIAQYYIGAFVLVGLSLVLNICTNKMMRTRSRSYPHRGLSWITIDVLGKITCLDKDAYRIEDEMPSQIETEMSDRDGMEVRTHRPGTKLRPAQMEWLMVGVVMDRFLFLLFLILVIAVTIVMLNF